VPPRPSIRGLLAACLYLLLAACGARSSADDGPGVMARAIVHEAGAFGAAGLARLRQGMGPGAARLATRFDPAVHTDFWDRPAAWTTLNLGQPPTLPVGQLSQADAALLNSVLPNDLAYLEPAQPFILKATGPERERAVLCMTQAVYYEAAFEPLEGQQAVAQTVINRMRHPYFPKSVCGVVYQGSEVPIYCQFSFTCDGSLAKVPIPEYWARAAGVAQAALNGFVAKDVGSATFYHADYVFPRWGPQMVRIVQLGAHIFYRFPGPAGEVGVLNGRYGGNELAVSITGPPLDAIAAARAALGSGVYASAIAPLSADPPGTIAVNAPAAAQAVAPPSAVLMAAAAPPHIALPGQIVAGRRVPTREEIAHINAALPPAPPAAGPDDGPIATAHD
jgi:spore germination cell wall hydrolase CwlJ-like protein